MAAPIILLLAALVRRDGGPAFYRQQRIGYKGKSFYILKLRSMVPGAEDIIANDASLWEEYSCNYSLVDDPRATAIGRMLRATYIDELPQLINVLRGDMSLVGPRPVLYEETQMFGDLRELILSVRPGMTGWWQIHRTEITTYPERVQMEAWYVRHWSLALDFRIILETVFQVAKLLLKQLYPLRTVQ
jgi:lipopolysaccharide/colanic/teichoic acid biosynthesis glycosyltransferase